MATIPTRIEGPDPPARTPPNRDEVRAWLVVAERGDAEHMRQRSEPSPGMHAVSRWPAVYIKDYLTRQYLKAYIWCEAHGHSFEKLCKERDGWSVRSGRRKVAEALDTITALLAFEIADKGAGALVTAETLQPNSLTMRPYSTLPVARIGPDAAGVQT